jgi:hypothetical protein
VAWDCMTTSMEAPGLEKRYEFSWLEGGRTNVTGWLRRSEGFGALIFAV